MHTQKQTLICQKHGKQAIFICIEEHCKFKSGCEECQKSHKSLKHLTFLTEELKDSSTLKDFEKKIISQELEILVDLRARLGMLEKSFLESLTVVYSQFEKGGICGDDPCYLRNDINIQGMVNGVKMICQNEGKLKFQIFFTCNCFLKFFLVEIYKNFLFLWKDKNIFFKFFYPCNYLILSRKKY